MKHIYFIILGLLLPKLAMAQAPGGVSGFSAWYKGDVDLTSTGWADQSSNNYDLTRGASIANSNYINFNPVATFNNTTTHTYSSVATAKANWPVTNSASTYYYVAKNTSTTAANRGVSGIGANGSTTGFHSGEVNIAGRNVGSGGAVAFTGTDGISIASPNWNPTATNQGINLVRTGKNTAGAAGTNYLAIQGNAETASTATVNPTYTNTSVFRIGSTGVSGTGNWIGDVAEVLVYPSKHAQSDYDKIESYLAIKYGVTLSHNYLLSSATAWSSSTNTGYNNNIAGITRDDVSGLNQKQSMSVNSGNQLLISTTGVANTNQANTISLTNGQALLWGDNNLARSLSTALAKVLPAGDVSHRFAAIWKIQNTGSVGTVRVMWPAIITNLHLVQSTDAVFDATDTFTSMANTVTVNGVSYAYADVTLGNGSFFTFAGYVTAPGGINTNLQLWLKGDVELTGTTWNDQSLNGRNAIATGVPTSTKYINFNASATVNGTNYYSIAHNAALNQDASNKMTLVVVAITPTGSYGMLVNKHTGGNWDEGWGMAQQGNTNNNMGFWTGDWTGSAPTNPAYTNFIPNSPALFFGYSTAATGNSNFLAYNGGNAVASTSAVNTQTNTATVKIGDQTGGAASHTSNIAEVIMYNTDQSGFKNRIESYLAIKYGISKSGDYTASNGTTTYWSASSNSGYNNNIAGITRDDASGLHQKQSMSVNSGNQVLISTTGVADTNQVNTVGLTNGQALLWGDNNLAKSFSTALVKVLPTGDVSNRFAAIWKVQNTGNVGTVRVMWPANITNLHLVQSTDAVFDATDTFTSMSNTVTVNGASYAYADVTLGNGSFFTFAGYVTAPGGVLQPDVWLRANIGTSTSVDNASVSEWENYGASGGKAVQFDSFALPTFTSNKHNFNPAITDNTYSGTGDGAMKLLNVYPTQVNRALESYALASQSDVSTANTVLFTYTSNTTHGADNERPRFGFNNATDFSFWWSGYTSGTFTVGPRISDKPYFTGYSLPAATAGTSHTRTWLLNGKTTSSSANAGTVGQNLFIFTDSNGNDNSGGDMSELITYSRILSASEKVKVNSYLAIKYGITLDQTTPNYMSSSTTIWDAATANAGYNNNIAGIIRDDASGLHQKQSMSVNSDLQVLISTTGVANTNQANTIGLTNGQALLWGDNNLYKRLITPLVATLPAGNINRRFQAVWKVQNTGSVGTVRVMWEAGITNLHLVQSTDAVFNTSDTFTSMANTVTINGTSYAYADVTLADGSFFTFAGFATGPGGVVDPLIWVRAGKGTNTTTNAAGVSSWVNYGIGAGRFTTLGTTTNPVYTNNAMNFNPMVGYNALCQGCGLKNAGVNPSGGGVMPITSYAVNVRDSWPYGYVPTITFPNANGGQDNNYASLANTSSTQWQLYAHGPSANLVTVPTQIANRPYISSLNFPAVGQAVYTTQNGVLINTGNNVTSGYYVGLDANLFAEGRSVGTGAGYHSSYGHMSEVTSYTRTLSNTERIQLESYLAIKYGITLLNDTGTATRDYLNSDGNKVWTNLTAYQNNVFGIGRDDISELHQRISKSASSSTLTVSTDTNFTNANSAHTNIESDKQFLIFGDNNGAIAFSGGTAITATDGTTFSASEVLARRWKAQDFGSVDCVNLRFNDALFTTLTGTAKYYIITADNATFTQNVRYKEVSALSNNIDIIINFADNTSTTSSGGSYFTIAKKDLGIAKADLTSLAVGINTIPSLSGWKPSAKNTYLEISSNSKGLIVSRVANTSAIASPISGMLIYDLSDNSFKIYTGTTWRKLSGSGDTTIFCN